MQPFHLSKQCMSTHKTGILRWWTIMKCNFTPNKFIPYGIWYQWFITMRWKAHTNDICQAWHAKSNLPKSQDDGNSDTKIVTRTDWHLETKSNRMWATLIVSYVGSLSILRECRIYILSYYHHQIGSTSYYPLFRVRSWSNGIHCMSFYVHIVMAAHQRH